jgi:pimeloyl-ACP methyl ester carboxylesterase
MPSPNAGPGRTIYLHGFASSPQSSKAQRFASYCNEHGISLGIPDFNEGGFRGLTIGRQLQQVDRLVRESDDPVVLIGSSLGGYTAALYAASASRVRALVLMCPAFDFYRRWTTSLGSAETTAWEQRGEMETMHFATDRPEKIGWSLMTDAKTRAAFPTLTQPTLILHGRNDDVVPLSLSQHYAAERPNVELVVLESDHGLGDVVNTLIERTFSFLSRLK